MGKTLTLAIVIIIACVILLVPRYDLYEKESSFSDTLILQQTGFWSMEECEAAGRAAYQEYFRCKETSAFKKMVSRSEDYKSEREY